MEILNITEEIPDQKLENYVINFLKQIDVKISSFKIVAVHRLGRKKAGKTRSVVVRLLNRKDAILPLKNRSQWAQIFDRCLYDSS